MMRSSLAILLTLVVAAWTAIADDPPARRIVLASQDGGDFARAVVDLATAELSRDTGLVLLDRAALEKVLAEQKLSLASLVSPGESLRVGALLKADLIVVVAGLKPKEPGAVTAFEVRGCRRLLDRELSAGAAADAVAVSIAQAVRETAVKERNTAALKTVSFLPVHNVDLSPLELSTTRALLTLTGRRLVQSGNVALLEREHLGLFDQEKRLPGGEDGNGSAAAALWQIAPEAQHGPDGNRLRLNLSVPGSAKGSLQVLVPAGNALGGLVDDLSRDILGLLAETPVGAGGSPEQEAQLFLARAKILAAMCRYKEALQAMDTVVVLDPTTAMQTERERMTRTALVSKQDVESRIVMFEALHAYWQAGCPFPSGIESLRSAFNLPRNFSSVHIPEHLLGRVELLYAEHARLCQAYLDRMFAAVAVKPSQKSVLELGVTIHWVAPLVSEWSDPARISSLPGMTRIWPEYRISQGLRWLELLARTPIQEDACSTSPAHDDRELTGGLDQLLNLQARLHVCYDCRQRCTPDLPLPTPEQRELRRRHVAAIRALPLSIGRHYAALAEINDTWVDARGGAQPNVDTVHREASLDVGPADRATIDARLNALQDGILQDIARLESSGNATPGAVRSLYFAAVNANYFRSDAAYGESFVGLWRFMRDRGKVEPVTLELVIAREDVPGRDALLAEIKTYWDAGRLSFHGDSAQARKALERALERAAPVAPTPMAAAPWIGQTRIEAPLICDVMDQWQDQVFVLTSDGNTCDRISLNNGKIVEIRLARVYRPFRGITSLRASERFVAIWDNRGPEIVDLQTGSSVVLDTAHGLPYENVHGLAIAGPAVYFFLRSASTFGQACQQQDVVPFYVCKYDMDRRILSTLATNTRNEPATPLDAIKKSPWGHRMSIDLFSIVWDRRRDRLVFNFPDADSPCQLWEYRITDGVFARLPVILPTDRGMPFRFTLLNDRFAIFKQQGQVGLYDLATDKARLLLLDHNRQLPSKIPVAGLIRRKAVADDKGDPCYGITLVGDELWSFWPAFGRIRADGSFESFPGDFGKSTVLLGPLDERIVLLQTERTFHKLHLREPLRLLPEGPPTADEVLPGVAVP